MVRMPSFARRPEEATATEDRNRDGRVDQRDERADPPATDTRQVTVREQVDDRGDRRGGTTTDVATRRQDADRAAAERAAAERAADQAEAERAGAERADTETAERQRVADRTVERAPAGPKPRASVLATLGLIAGVAAALMVLTGVLAGYGIAVGIVGLLLSIGGVSATGKRHVAGKSDALIGIVLNISAMVIGALALTGALSWLTTETDKVDQFRQWLDAQFGDRF